MKRLTFFAVLAAASLAPLQAGNIVLNPGFETDDFTSWTVTAAADGSDIHTTTVSNTGFTAAAFGGTTPGSFDSLSQSLTTIDGKPYLFSFFLQGSFGEGGEGSASLREVEIADPVGNFQAYWNGTLLLDSKASNSAAFGYTQFTFSEVGSGNDIITFKGYNVPAHYFLDDVSVAVGTVPEPSTWALMSAGLVALIGFRRAVRRASAGARL